MISKIVYRLRNASKKNKLFFLPFIAALFLSELYVYFKSFKNLDKKGINTAISFYQFSPYYFRKISNNIIWLHGSVNYFFSKRFKFLYQLYYYKLRKYDKIVVICEEMKSEVLDFYPSLHGKVECCYNPFDFKNITVKSKLQNRQISQYRSPGYILSVGRLDENQKDFSTLIKSYARLKLSKDISEFLVIVGDGPDKHNLVRLSESLGVENHVVFVGNQLNPYPWFRDASCFVLSSKYEGLPTVLIEAQILETPIISSKCKTGVSEILLNGEAGMLFEVGNIDELSSCLLNLLSSKRQQKKFIQVSSENLERFNKGFILNNIEESLISGRNPILTSQKI